MTSDPAETNESTATQATLAFLTEHLGHRISTFHRRRGKRHYFTLAELDPGADRASEPYERPWWLTGPDTEAHGPSYSIRHVFTNVDELSCTECRTSREWADVHTATLTALKTIAAPYLTGATAAFSSGEHLRDATAMARLIATLTGA
ncbi:MAG TPA: hypothetical protein VL551_34080 [Actinospica sp.]|jgi:hypothetical protein|nr:hypothetical protein [Actinospica sp.]